MQRKLNEEYIREYSEQFSEKITSDIFEQQETISGKEILSCTPSRQVNLFIIKLLFQNWQEEMKRLESPFFNYKAAEVRKAMVQFMNTLSQHIEVDGDHFIELAENATRQTLLLAADPSAYIRQEFGALENAQLSEKVTKPMIKYIKLHHETISDLFDEYKDSSIDQFFEELDELLAEYDTEPVLEDVVELLNQVCPITTDRLFEPEEKEEADSKDVTNELPVPDLVEEEQDETVDEEQDTESSNIPKEEDPEINEVAELENDEQVSEEIEEENKEEAADEEEEIAETPTAEEHEEHEEADEAEDTTEEEPAQVEEPADKPIHDEADEANSEEEDELASSSINERFSAEPETVNKQFERSSEATIAEQLEKTKVDSIMEAISVNHQYMFTKELFEGDRASFNQAISEIDECDSFDDAVEMIVQNHAKARSWDMNSDEVKELLKVVFRKFRD